MKFGQTVVDSHMHLVSMKDSEGRIFYDFFDGLQKEHGLMGLNICSCCITGWGIENIILCALYKMHNPTSYAYGSFFYPDKPISIPMPDGLDFENQYNELLDLGFDGIKLLETKTLEQNIYNVCVDAEYFEGFFDKCEKDGTHIIWHVADPDTFWDINRIPKRHLAKGWYYGDGNYLKWEEIYQMVFNVLDRHPKLKVTFAHFLFYSEHPEWLVEMFEKYPNVGIDVTPGAEMYNAFRDKNDFYKEFFKKYADRIMFGTDVTFGGSKTGPLRLDAVYKFLTTSEEVTVVDVPTKGIDLPEMYAEKILYRNFENVASDSPKKINTDLLKRYVKKYEKYIINEDVKALLKEKDLM